MKDILYTDPRKHKPTISADVISGMDTEDIKAVMRCWFYERYGDPVHYCHWADGEYVYVYGGPFDAREELCSEFLTIVSEELIEELANELNEICYEWSAIPSKDFPDEDYEIEAILSNKQPFMTFTDNIQLLKHLLAEEDKGNDKLQRFQLMMIYTFTITCLETYLSDILMAKINKYPEIKKQYLQSEQDLKGQKFPLSTIVAEDIQLTINKIINKKILETVFHRLEYVKALFQNVFNIDIGNISELKAKIKMRHDFVHKSGKDESNQEIHISKSDVNNLIHLVEEFCWKIRDELEDTWPTEVDYWRAMEYKATIKNLVSDFAEQKSVEHL